MRIPSLQSVNSRVRQRPYQSILLLVSAIAGLSYASFPLALWLNKPFAMHGEVSMLGEAGQPHASVFNGLDVVSSILLTGLCIFLLLSHQQSSRSWRWAIRALLLSSVGALAAAVLPLPTIFIFPDSIHALLHISTAVFIHGFASFVNTGAFIVSAILWVRIMRQYNISNRRRLLLAYSIFAIVTFGPILTFIKPFTGDVTQRVFISLFAVWLVIFTYDALQTRNESTIPVPIPVKSDN